MRDGEGQPDHQTQVAEAVQRYWGFDALRPLQAEAIAAGIAHRDSLVVMPTGGGKSLCYQVPPVIAGRMDLVVSPLISLMKDQVDGLLACGYPAACLHSGMDAAERRDAERQIRDKACRLVFVAPERLISEQFQSWIEPLGIRAIAVDEAHCISHWGHDFRPEYRRLAELRDRFPDMSMHAFTATATPRVRDDIVTQLRLENPVVMVGRFDRPNLVYRIVPRTDVSRQVLDVVRRHPREAIIVYCITRKETETLAAMLAGHGIQAASYHAGMEPHDRKTTQEAFSQERLDVVVATVAFGMGIDRSNVRCVIHAAMPKSVEHYQQETGRAGRDGLEAECILFYSAADFMRWENLLRKSAQETDDPDETIAPQLVLLRHMQRICSGLRCRHEALSDYFGQPYDTPDCGACDVCMGEVTGMTDGMVTAQKILSCVVRAGQRFGVGHIVDILTGANTEQIRSFGHDELSTYSLLDDMPSKVVQNLIYQLVDHGMLERTPGDRPILQLSSKGAEVLRGERDVRLREPMAPKAKRTVHDTQSWEGVDRELFERLRAVRRDIARKRSVPAYIVFGDATLRHMAQIKPDTLDAMRTVHGIGDRKLAAFGQAFLDAVTIYLHEHNAF
ncbi:MAG: DNA helicase RecQ [Phycisphaerales bacterium]|nr:DNA helicase RecQ [Phycisphaerales bacterium]